MLNYKAESQFFNNILFEMKYIIIIKLLMFKNRINNLKIRNIKMY